MNATRIGVQAVGQRGRSLIELMISITIGFVVLAAILAIYSATSSTNRQSSSVSRISEDAAIATNFIANNLRVAGFSPPRVIVAPGTVVVFDGATVAFPDRNFGGAAVRGCDNGFTNNTAAFAALTCAAGTGPAAFAMRFEGDADSTPAVIVGGVTFPSDCLNQAVTVTATSAYDAAPYPLVESRFWVQTNAGSGTPELYCAGNGSGFTGQPVVQYVENMVISYGLAANPLSNQIVRYASAAQVDALGPDVNLNWGRVLSLQICLVLRSASVDQAGASNYTDCAGNSVASPNGFMRRSYTTVFALRNRTGA